MGTGKIQLGLAILAAAAAVRAAHARDDDRVRIEAQVSSIAGPMIYITAGSDDGVAAGDFVDLYPDAAPEAKAIVRVVSRQSARIEFTSHGEGVAVGTRALVNVSAERRAQSARRADVPEHPPWSDPMNGWNSSMPLLASRNSAGGSEPPPEARVRGRIYSQGSYLRDQDTRREYSLVRAGMNLVAENPFGTKAALEFNGELYDRRATRPGTESEEQQRGRIDRLSYHAGDEPDDRVRYEFGRFIQHEFPEFGLVDGAEVTFRPGPLDRFGASIGLLPDYTPELTTGKDAQSSVYYRHLFDERGATSLGAGYQKTLHDGKSDRDLFVLSGQRFSSDGLTLLGTAWIDVYTSADRFKSAGPELSQLLLTASLPLGAASGIGAQLSHVRFPETLHDELPPLAGSILKDFQVTRAGLNAWQTIEKKLRLSERVDRWIDRHDDGGSGELRADWRDLLLDDGEIGASAYRSDGSFTSIFGARFSARQSTRVGDFGLGYEFMNSDSVDNAGSGQSLREHLLRGSWDVDFGRSWNFSLYAEQRFSDAGNSIGLGFYLSVRM